MFFGEIALTIFTTVFRIESFAIWLFSYIGGFFGSMAAIPVSIVLTVKKVSLTKLMLKRGKNMEDNISNNLKIKLLIYLLISAVTFTLLVTPENAGISVLLFTTIQIICLWFISPDKKRLLFFIPILAMSLNCFISANNIWRLSNLIVSAVLIGSMFIKFDFKNDKLNIFADVIVRSVIPFTHFLLPFKWASDTLGGKAPVIKRVLLALVIAVPCAVLLIILLSTADMVFYTQINSFVTNTKKMINFHSVLLIILGIIAGIYLFGVMYTSHTDDSEISETSSSRFSGDLVIINILLCVVLVIYTVFVFIQFKYLFAGANLPSGLTYTEYARKGFFELLFVTVINIVLIITVIKLTKSQNGKGALFTKILCHYLCTITVILLISSFYRMILYSNDDGLTRMRLFVMGFLIFELLGLFATFFYIAKPKFNIVLLYAIAALSYYTVLNIIPTDNIIAQNQIEKYISGERNDLDYVFTLSADAAPAVKYLILNSDDEEIIKKANEFMIDKAKSNIPNRWQRFNISRERVKKMID